MEPGSEGCGRVRQDSRQGGGAGHRCILLRVFDTFRVALDACLLLPPYKDRWVAYKEAPDKSKTYYDGKTDDGASTGALRTWNVRRVWSQAMYRDAEKVHRTSQGGGEMSSAVSIYEEKEPKRAISVT